jgi:hypothetical protein
MTSNNKIIQKIDMQIERIENLIEQLLGGIDVSELSTSERLTHASRLMGLVQRDIALKQTIQLDQPENRENLLIAAFMRQMRGETSSSEAMRIVEQDPLQGIEAPSEEEEDG